MPVFEPPVGVPSDVLGPKDPREANGRPWAGSLRDMWSMWSRTLLQHRGHANLRCFDSPLTLVIGFHCNCKKPAFSMEVGLGLFRTAPAEVQQLRLTLPRIRHPGEKQAWMDARRAQSRARVLLHQNLTREQRWSLRATRSFLVQGQDGRTYQVRENQTVRLLVNGRPTLSYCIHPTEPLPPFDVMLTQKLLLENEIELFLATAKATEVTHDARQGALEIASELRPTAGY